MKLRKAETAELAALLEAGAESPEMLAQDFTDALERLLAKREQHYGIGVTYGLPVVIGPYATRNQAEKGLGVGVFERAWTVRGYTPIGWADHLAEVDREPEPHEPSAKEQAARDKGFWQRAHAIREGNALGVVASEIKAVRL